MGIYSYFCAFVKMAYMAIFAFHLFDPAFLLRSYRWFVMIMSFTSDVQVYLRADSPGLHRFYQEFQSGQPLLYRFSELKC